MIILVLKITKNGKCFFQHRMKVLINLEFSVDGLELIWGYCNFCTKIV